MEMGMVNVADFLRRFDDPGVVEVWNGAWFCLSVAMAISFFMIGVRRVYVIKEPPELFLKDLAFQLSMSLSVFCVASAMRAGYSWLTLHCENINSREQCAWVEEHYNFLAVGQIMALISGVLILRLLTPPPWKPWLWVSSALLSVGLPALFYITTKQLAFGNVDGDIQHGHHSPVLVACSIGIAMLGFYSALKLVRRARDTSGNVSLMWAVFAAIAMGIGIWSMHFVGMMAFSMDEKPVAFDAHLTVLSLLIPMFVTMIGFMTIHKTEPGLVPLMMCGVFIGIGITTMHYTGMAAMMMVKLTYDPVLFVLSGVIAVVASCVAVWLAFNTNIESRVERKILASIIGGTAIAGMHYTAMAGTRYSPVDHMQAGGILIEQSSLAVWVTVASAVILLLFVGAVMFDTYREEGAAAAGES